MCSDEADDELKHKEFKDEEDQIEMASKNWYFQ